MTADAPKLRHMYKSVRQQTLKLTETLEPEDTVVQTMPDVSPTKWHMAHTTWFFETFVVSPRIANYTPYHPRFHYLFNSYYYTAGQMHLRPQRGLLSRPTLNEVLAYREHIDEAILELIEKHPTDSELAMLVTLGLNHEQQHQELILTDIKHVFSCNPLQPALIEAAPTSTRPAPELKFLHGESGLTQVGFNTAEHGQVFSFDNETPRHEQLVRPHALASRPVTNSEFTDFIQAGGYRESQLWLSDGWSTVNEHDWSRPLYWAEDLQSHYTLQGVRDIDPDAPVTHVSFYEADAFARWAEARLPTEFELELALDEAIVEGNFVESGHLQPRSAGRDHGSFHQLYGDVWEWTASAYAAYPGFKPLNGSLGEYNGKFMCNQMVLRGGSCATPYSHIRPTYRNFFYPDARWQFSGIRLATDT